MGQFRDHHSGKTRTMALFWLRTSYHAQRYMFQRNMLRSFLTRSFSIVNTLIILLFSKKWVPGFAAEDNSNNSYMMYAVVEMSALALKVCNLIANSDILGKLWDTLNLKIQYQFS